MSTLVMKGLSGSLKIINKSFCGKRNELKGEKTKWTLWDLNPRPHAETQVRSVRATPTLSARNCFIPHVHSRTLMRLVSSY
jgi:hypothetical protein